MSEFERDSELHDEAISQLYKKLPPAEPQPATDAAILAAASAAVSAKARPGRWWLGGLATAASLVLVVGLVRQWQTDPAARWQQELAVGSGPMSAPVATEAPALLPESRHQAAAPVAPAATVAKAKPASPQARPEPVAPVPAVAATMAAPVAEVLADAQAPAEAEAADRREARADQAEERLVREALASEAVAKAEAKLAAVSARKMMSAPAPALAAQPGSHVRLMEQARYAEALAALDEQTLSADIWTQLDRDLLRLLNDQDAAPACSSTSGPALARQACALLQQYRQTGHIPQATLDGFATELSRQDPAHEYWSRALRQLTSREQAP